MPYMFHDLFAASKLPTSKYDTYFDAYDKIFASYRGREVTFVEVGVMGGGSLEAFKQFFAPTSRVIGIDLNPELEGHFSDIGYEFFVGDAGDLGFWDEFYRKVGEIDILLDDGGHTNHQVWTTFRSALPQVRDGGCIVVEDTHASYIADFGNPSDDSFISRMKLYIDEISYRSSRIPDLDAMRDTPTWLRDFPIEDAVHSIQFFESIVVASIDRSLCRRSTRVDFGSAEALPQGRVPEDFRSRGVTGREPRVRAQGGLLGGSWRKGGYREEFGAFVRELKRRTTMTWGRRSQTD